MPDPHPLIPLVPQSSSLTLTRRPLIGHCLAAPGRAPGGGTGRRGRTQGSGLSLVTELLLDWEPRRVTARAAHC
eukprot:654662-Hanusia_phi.AAC.1